MERALSDDSETEDSPSRDIHTQTSRRSILSKHSVGLASVEDNVVAPAKPNVCIQIEEALHLPKYLCGEEHLEPEVYVSCQLPEAKVVSTDALKSVKPKWNFRTDVTMDVQVLKEKRFEFKLWRCVQNGKRSSKDLLIGVAEIDTSPLFYGRENLILV